MNDKLIRVERALNDAVQAQMAAYNRGRTMIATIAKVLPVVGVFGVALGWEGIQIALSQMYSGSIFIFFKQMRSLSSLALFISAVFIASLWFWDLMTTQLERQMRTASNELMACLIGVEARNGRL